MIIDLARIVSALQIERWAENWNENAWPEFLRAGEIAHCARRRRRFYCYVFVLHLAVLLLAVVVKRFCRTGALIIAYNSPTE